MAFEKMTVPREYHPLKNSKPGDVLCEGTYIRRGEDKFGGVTHEFKGDDVIHVLNSAGHLNWLMKEYVDFGDYCRVSYKGKEPLKSGKFQGTESHAFDLDVDPERSVKVAPTTSTDEEQSHKAGEDLGEYLEELVL